jgi:hypothetical protein
MLAGFILKLLQLPCFKRCQQCFFNINDKKVGLQSAVNNNCGTSIVQQMSFTSVFLDFLFK